MGSPPSEIDRYPRESQHKRRIDRSFAISSKHVTKDEYERLAGRYALAEKYERFPDLPIVAIDWHMAAKYCNLLSKIEGIEENQWCYEENPATKRVKVRKNCLRLSGYRLSTEAEMEYTTRADARTSRYYGESEELLGYYAWFEKNSNAMTQQVGRKMPNDFGLFDTHGNCYTWCQERYSDYPAVAPETVVDDDKEVAILEMKPANSRVLRGGSFGDPASNLRAASRYGYISTEWIVRYGFRIARTLPPMSAN
jgi:formylglycine-generating enzyme required for sulfatase activity